MSDKKKNPNIQDKAEQAAKAFVNEASFQTDPNGSYTGRSKDCDEAPVQDADDL